MKIARKVLALMLLVSMLFTVNVFQGNTFAADDTTILAKDAEWKYLDNGVDLGTAWRNADFDDSAWKKGKAPLGFGDDFSETDPTLPLATKVEFGDPTNKHMTTYFRTTVNASNLSGYSALEVYLHVDDGAVVYVNGKEAFRRGIDDGVAVDYKTSAKFKPKEETFQIPVSALKEGVNTIAAEVHQDGGDSSDLWFEMSIKGVKGTKDTKDTKNTKVDAAVLAKDAEWKYLDNGVDLGTAWRNADFDDSAWKKGKAPLGFGDDFSETDPTLPLATKVEFGDPTNKHMTTYFRTTVNASNLSGYSALEVYLHVDDGAVVYVNGKEAFRRGIDDGVAVDYKTSAKFKPKEETFQIPVSALKEGVNTIAAEVHQDGGDSSDLWFEMSIKALAGTETKDTGSTKIVVPDPKAPKGTVSNVTVTFNGDTKTSKGFTWYTTLASANSDLQVVEKTDAAPDFSKAKKFSGKYSVMTHAPSFPLEVVHKAEATGLKANTTYYFRVGDEKLGIWSDTGTFQTAPEGGAFTFVDLADTQAKSEDEAILSAETIAKALETVNNAKFFAINGDLVDTGLNAEQWNWLLGHSQQSLLNTTILPAAGNHDEDKNAFIEHFNIKTAPNSDTATGAYFSVDYSNAHFIVLNNNEDSKEYADFTPAQIQWLKDDVKAAKAAGTEWIIVIMHKGPFTTSNHATDADIMGPNGVRTLVAPLMAEYGIDFVLQGHDHIYARTKPIKKDGTAENTTKITESVNGKSIEYTVKPDGTIYLIPATAGPKVYYKNKKINPSYYDLFEVADENHASVYGPDPADASRPVRSQIQNFVGITIDGGKLTAITYEIDKSKDNGKPYIVDQFGITKNAVPTAEKVESNQPQPVQPVSSPTQSAEAPSQQTVYIVVPGDSLWKIAQIYGTTWQELAEVNGLANPDLIYPDQQIVIPAK